MASADSVVREAGVLPASRLSRALVAIVRVGVALLWIDGASWKLPPHFDSLHGWVNNAVDYPVLAPYAWLVKHLVLPNFTPFAWGVLVVEASLGAFLLIGLATRFWALVGIAQTTVITLSALNTPHEWVWSYLLMLLAHLGLFAVAAGRYGGLDGVLRARWQTIDRRWARLLVRAS